MSADAPTIHSLDDASLLGKLTARERPRSGEGLHVVVHVAEGGNTAYGRIVDSSSPGHNRQRWVKHARRGSSPGGWTEAPHPRSEADVAAWMTEHESALDRLLIDCSKRAWKLDAEAPYLAEFPPLPLPARDA